MRALQQFYYVSYDVLKTKPEGLQRGSFIRNTNIHYFHNIHRGWVQVVRGLQRFENIIDPRNPEREKVDQKMAFFPQSPPLVSVFEPFCKWQKTRNFEDATCMCNSGAGEARRPPLLSQFPNILSESDWLNFPSSKRTRAVPREIITCLVFFLFFFFGRKYHKMHDSRTIFDVTSFIFLREKVLLLFPL